VGVIILLCIGALLYMTWAVTCATLTFAVYFQKGEINFKTLKGAYYEYKKDLYK